MHGFFSRRWTRLRNAGRFSHPVLAVDAGNGWTGYASQKPPSPKTMHLGLVQFRALGPGWTLSQEREHV